MNADTIICLAIAGVIACNAGVVILATRNAAQRQKAIQQAPNVYSFYQRVDLKA